MYAPWTDLADPSRPRSRKPAGEPAPTQLARATGLDEGWRMRAGGGSMVRRFSSKGRAFLLNSHF
jgi:hypothetical protein